jgi:hypothetical protein
MGNFVSPSIKYYRINANNTAIAQSFDGTNNGAIPTEEIAAPLYGGTLSNYNPGTLTITGQAGSQFQTLFSPNQYVYFLDSGVYRLVGQIAAIASNTSMTINAAAVNVPTPTGVQLYASFGLITGTESIYMRIETVGPPSSPANTRFIPNFGVGFWRSQTNITGENIPQQSKIEQISQTGNPLSNASQIQNIPFTFVSMNLFRVASLSGSFTGNSYFGTTSDFPQYVWIRITPQIGANTILAGQTLFRFTTQDSMEALQVGLNTSASVLQQAGYSNVGNQETN